MPINLEEIFNQLKTEVSGLAQSSLKNYVAQAKVDGQNILILMKNDLENWTVELASGQLTPDDFKDLVLGQKDNLKMAGLTQVGLATIESDRFKQAILNLIVSTITSKIG